MVLNDKKIKRLFDDWYRSNEKDIREKVSLEKNERNKFIKNFPLSKIENKELELDGYVAGKGGISFCNLIEFYTKNFERISLGAASAYGIFYSEVIRNYNIKKGQSYITIYNVREANNYFKNNILENIYNLIDYCKNKKYSEIDNNYNFKESVPYVNVRRKIIHLYFPDKFIHINGNEYLIKLGQILGINGTPTEIANKSLEKLKSITGENDSYILSVFAWRELLKQETGTGKKSNIDMKSEKSISKEERYIINKIENYLNRNPNLILYGPPGTGKTYWVRQYVKDKEKIIKKEKEYADDFINFIRPIYEEYKTKDRIKKAKSKFDEISKSIKDIKNKSDNDFEELLYDILYSGYPININRPWAHKVYEKPKIVKNILIELFDSLDEKEKNYGIISNSLNKLKDKTDI
jgi:ABC-type molybdenum transport system ATPase subunit/photorepair protein PhrA